MNNDGEKRGAAPESHAAAESLREALERRPRAMTLELAREFGVPEVEVIRAFPDGRAVELDVSRWAKLFERFEALGRVRVLVSNGAATIEATGSFGGFSTTGGYFNVQTDSLDLHVRWRELAAAFAVEKPGHMDGRATYSVQLFDRSGAAALKVFVNFGETISPERLRLFRELREGFRATTGTGG